VQRLAGVLLPGRHPVEHRRLVGADHDAPVALRHGNAPDPGQLLGRVARGLRRHDRLENLLHSAPPGAPGPGCY
jgi:hypothetical protein